MTYPLSHETDHRHACHDGVWAIGIAGLILNHIGGPHPDCKVHPANRPDRACPECEVLAGAQIIEKVRADAKAEALEVAAHALEGDTHVPDHQAGRAAIQYLRDRADQYRGQP